MKKLARILSLVLVAVVLCAALASCGAKPAENADDAVAALKENGYDAAKVGDVVTGEKDGEFIAINYCTDEASAKDAYEEAQEELAEAKEQLAKAEEELEKAEAELEEVKDDAILKPIAEAAVEVAQNALDKLKMYAECEIGQSGNMVWMGTKQAIKDAK